MSFKIEAQVREEQGTGASRRLRREGRVPAVVYGAGSDATAVSVDHKTVFFALQKEEFHTAIIKLALNGKEHDVIVRDFQMHPVRREVRHIDFKIVEAGKPIKISLPLHVVNSEKSQAVKLQNSRVALLSTSVEVLLDPKHIPSELVLDCEKVVAGDVLHLSDIQYPEGVESTSLRRGANLAVATVTAAGK